MSEKSEQSVEQSVEQSPKPVEILELDESMLDLVNGGLAQQPTTPSPTNQCTNFYCPPK